MHERNSTSTGFTIVELLIVIVVIAILAAISIVAFTGIQNRGYDSAVQSDLSNFAKRIQLAAAESGEYPAGGRRSQTAGGPNTGSIILPPHSIDNFTISHMAYHESTSPGESNFVYCEGVGIDSEPQVFNITARSKSQKVFRYSSIDGLRQFESSNSMGSSTVCGGIDYPLTRSYGYFSDYGGWQSWVE